MVTAVPATTENNSLASIEPMTPTEAEILLSSKLAEKRSSVLSDEQAEEVCKRPYFSDLRTVNF